MLCGFCSLARLGRVLQAASIALVSNSFLDFPLCQFSINKPVRNETISGLAVSAVLRDIAVAVVFYMMVTIAGCLLVH